MNSPIQNIAGARRFVLLVRRFRCGRGGEFLEARIIPKRIEHGIELEQCGSERQKLSEKFSVYCFGASD
jgi:hypothetical protein